MSGIPDASGGKDRVRWHSVPGGTPARVHGESAPTDLLDTDIALTREQYEATMAHRDARRSKVVEDE